MIELTQIEIEIGYGSDCELVEVTRVEVLELITRLREAERDAARYRWLRDRANSGDLDIMCVIESLEWDGVIDQAMKGKGDE